MKLTSSLLEANLNLIEKMKESNIDSSPLERMLVEVLLEHKIDPRKIKKHQQTFDRILLKLEAARAKIFKLGEKETLESKFSHFFYIDDSFLDDEEFSLDEARREFKMITKQSKKQRLNEDPFDYSKGLELLRRNLNLALTSKSSYIRGLAQAMVEEEKHSRPF